MMYDSFMFFKDFDMLEIRLEEHWDMVDKFIITEAPFTQSYKAKPLYYKENQDRFKKYQEKIIYCEMDGKKFEPDKHFHNERLQRNYFRTQIYYHNNDVFILSDADEIMNSEILMREEVFAGVAEHGVVAINLSFHHYYVNYVVKDFRWTGPVITTGRILRTFSPSHLRRKANDHGLVELNVDNAGWHFSWAGGIDKIYEKLEAVCNKEYVTETYLSKMDFETRIRERVTFDFLTDGYKLTLDNNMVLPKYLMENKGRFSNLFYKGEQDGKSI